MKQTFAIFLSLVMLASFSVTAFAATDITATDPQPYTATAEGEYTIDVNGEYVTSQPVQKVISVDLSWEALTFTYTDEKQGTWIPGEHHYEGAVAAAWSQNKPAITVANHSDSDITVLFSFANAAENGPTGTFYTVNGEDYTSLSASEQHVFLDTAVGTDTDNPPTGKLCFGISGEAITASQKLGTITVHILEGTVHTVSTKAELSTALEMGDTVRLLNDIDLGSDSICMEDGGVLDLNGHTLTTDATECLSIESAVTVKNGTIQNTKNMNKAVAKRYPASASIENCTLISNNYFALYIINGSLTMKDCTLQGAYSGNSLILDPSTSSFQSSLEMSGNITMSGGVMDNGYTVTVKAGTYSFNPTAYVDADVYTVTQNDTGASTSWTVAAK